MIDKERASIQDIAEAADVSIATVSRVFNKSAKVREETAGRVLKVAKKLNYRPDRVARRMRVKSSDSLVIGLIVTDIGNPFFSELARGVEDAAYERKQALMICNTDEEPEKEKFYIESLLSEKVSGLIIAPSKGNAEYLEELVAKGYPVVCVDRVPDNLSIDTVMTDNERGAYLAVKRLIDFGHERIGIICGIQGISTTERRLAGYKKALNEAGLPIEDELIVVEDYKESGGRNGLRRFLALDNVPTAVFSTNNLMTLGCYEEMYEQNIDIPNDIAIIGFDDMPWAVALNPPLTAVRQPGYELGLNAAKLLFNRIEHPDRSKMDLVLSPELVVRKSCG